MEPSVGVHVFDKAVSFLVVLAAVCQVFLCALGKIIFISIDDNELINLSKVCEEVFSSSNRIAIFVVASNSSKNNAKYVSITHEGSADILLD